MNTNPEIALLSKNESLVLLEITRQFAEQRGPVSQRSIKVENLTSADILIATLNLLKKGIIKQFTPSPNSEGKYEYGYEAGCEYHLLTDKGKEWVSENQSLLAEESPAFPS